MGIEQILQNEIQESKRWIDTVEGVYKRDLIQRIELINWVLNTMRNPNSNSSIYEIIDRKMNETIQEIKKKDSIFESDILDSELRILDWIFYQVCKDQQKNWEKSLLGYQK